MQQLIGIFTFLLVPILRKWMEICMEIELIIV